MTSPAFSSLQKDKLMHMFELLDVDGNGVLEYDDFRMVVDTMAEERGWGPSHRRYIGLTVANRRLWKTMCRTLDADGSGEITLAEWLAFHIRALTQGTAPDGTAPELGSAIRATAKFFCDMLDSDGDGHVTAEDYVMFCGAYNVPESEALESFALFDRDGNGELTQGEVVEMVREFYLSDDPNAPGNLFFGCL